MYSEILKNVTKYVELSQEEIQLFTSILSYRKLPKRTMLLREGEICDFEGYIRKGCARIYSINEKGAEVTLSFAVEDWWVSDIESFQDRTPSKLYIEVSEDTEMFVLTPNSKETLLTFIPKFEKVFRMLVQNSFAKLQRRLISTITMTATERYLEFIELYPSIPLRVPQYYIASYLGVSPEFISTIRKRLSRK